MAENESEHEKNLREMRERLRAGLVKQHPPTEKRLEALQETLRQQWELKQRRLKDQSAGRGGKTRRDQEKKASQDQDQDQGYSH